MSRSEAGAPERATEVSHVAALGGGLIGRSWTALFLAAGKTVALFDPDPSAENRVREAVEEAWPMLRELGLTQAAAPEADLVVCADARQAVEGAQFVQERAREDRPEARAVRRDRGRAR